MSSRNLHYFFAPRSVAVVGASDRPRSVGATVIRNLLAGGFSGPVWPVNLKHSTVAGQQCFRTIADLPDAPDLAVICTPASTVPALIGQLGARGTRAAVVLSAGLEQLGADGRSFAAAMLESSRPYLLRILGPNCVGLLVPPVGLNASFAHAQALEGNLAFVAQSGALMTALLDWARAQNIGFSCCISLGNAADVDFGDLLDTLAADRHTRAVLLYIESIQGARKFMSAARAAARNKPVIVVKAGRGGRAAQVAATHTGALAGADEVYEAAFRRAGMLRVDTTRELFDAAETLARLKPLEGERLAIVTNGGGPAVMATDALIAGGGTLATLAPATLEALDQALPNNWSHSNPVDIIGDAPPQRYVTALEAVVRDPAVDATLLIHAPTAIVPAAEIARSCAPLLARSPRPVLSCWMGGEAVKEAADIFAIHGIATYNTPEEAVSAYLHMLRYRRNQQQLMEVPASMPEAFVPQPQVPRAIFAEASAQGRSVLTEPEAKQVLAAYGIPVVVTQIVSEMAELPSVAAALGYPVALKILSPDIIHKSDVGGVVLDLSNADELKRAAEAMLARCRERLPQARLDGFALQPMIKRSDACELIVGIAVDATFGPIVLFGQGGTAVEVLADKAVALPPLNTVLARELICRTRVKRLLAGYRDRPPVDMQALERSLVQIAQLAVDLPEVVELDINPLLADARGVIALDARVRFDLAAAAVDRLAIRPYPKEQEETVQFAGREILLRPIRPEDEPQHRAFLAQVNSEDLHSRFFHAVRELPRGQLAHLTQIDYERAMAFIAEARDAQDGRQTLGVARAHADPDNVTAEFAVLVRSDLKGRGLGSILLDKLIRYCRDRGLQKLSGEVLSDNSRMLALAERLGFHAATCDRGSVHVTLELNRIP